ncbi:DUF1772 domain-containing protein [Noviherbaspirillum soli]|uniref:DUF1772 domain-containing protein n=1 Tax=Noviherbaspirillum soli TaxID=1064518 RepID=UPI001E5A4C03|nr:DUF1772 domain-containing protein [Noviherbaspirillum soli]
MFRTLQFLAVLLTAITMAAGWAHLLELPNKMALSHADYLSVQQIYRGWALLGFVLVGALVVTVLLALLQRGEGIAFYFVAIAALAIALGLAVFLIFTLPVNRATQNWAILPPGWEALRGNGNIPMRLAQCCIWSLSLR